MFMAGAGTGLTASAALNRRAASFEEMLRFISFLKTQIRYTAAPINELLEMASNGDFPKLSFLKEASSGIKSGKMPSVSWCDAIKKYGGDCSFNDADREMLRKFGLGLGNSDVEGQLMHCDIFSQLFEDRLKAARSAVQSKGRLYVTLGITGGLGAALLLY